MQGQLKKVTARNKPQESTYVNERSKKNIPVPAACKVFPRRPGKIYNKQGGREKAFSKNEKKVSCSNSGTTIAQNFNSSDRYAVQDLLNFQYSSDRHVDSNYSHRYQFSRRKKTYFNKEEYLQAKCQFVVIGCVDDYAVNAIDPDKLVDWEQIHLVYLPSHESPNCPICLYTPVAAKMTRCGHIFCWSCILHYLHLSDKAWRKCPICHEAVHQNDLKSVKSVVQKKYERLDTITMQLMRRFKESISVMPKSECDPTKLEFSSWRGNSSTPGSKIALSTPEDVLKHILLREKDELKAQLDIDMADNNGEDTFISMALQILEQNIKTFKSERLQNHEVLASEEEQEENGIYDIDGNGSSLSDMLHDISVDNSNIEAAFSDDDKNDDENDDDENASAVIDQMLHPTADVNVNHQQSINTCSPPSDSVDQVFFDDAQCEDISSHDSGSVPSSVGSDYSHKPKAYMDSYYFYQAEDGQNVFLHSLNARCLMEEYGSLDAGPQKITGQIIDFECFTMTKELRKRFRYLSHLPLSSEFMICELILKPPLLSKNTIHNFMPEFKNRKALRLKKFKEQQKFDRRAIAAENKKLGFRNIEYDDDEEEIGIDLSNTEEFPSGLSPDGNEHDTKVVCEDKDDGGSQQFQGMSFAQMLNKKSDNVNSHQKERESTANTVYRSLQGTDAFPAALGEKRIPKDEDDGPDIVAPDFKQTFSAAMFATPIKSESKVMSGNGSGGKGKKKKDKGMLLFATGGQRKY